MQVILKVVGGKNDGREISIAVPEFVIGRGEDAHLRPTSDLVSRKHTAVKVADGKVIIEDLKSRNGTFVNGEKISAPHEAKAGDTMRVGRLQFEVVIDHVKPGNKKPRVQGVVDAAARTASAASSKKSSIEDSIADWLVDEEEEPSKDSRDQLKNAETIQLNLEDTLSLKREDVLKRNQSDSTEEDLEEGPKTDEEATEQDSSTSNKKKKKEPGKLPPVPKMSHGTSTNAADDVLRKFFNRR